MLSPTELKKKEFSKALGGYNTAEVEEYVSYLLSKYSEARNEYLELENKYKAATAKLDTAQNDEKEFSSIVLDAHKMADALMRDANEKSKAMVSEAEEKRDAILGSIKESTEHILEVYRERVAAERDKLAKAETLVAQFKESLYEAYREHVSMLDRILPDSAEDESISDATDEELVDSALSLAEKNRSSGLSEDELPPTRADKASENQEDQ